MANSQCLLGPDKAPANYWEPWLASLTLTGVLMLQPVD